MLENRETMLRMFPELSQTRCVQTVSDYPNATFAIARRIRGADRLSGHSRPSPSLTPGIHNSAFTNMLLAEQWAGIGRGHGPQAILDGRCHRTNLRFEADDVLYRRWMMNISNRLTLTSDSCVGVRVRFTSRYHHYQAPVTEFFGR